ncbi:MAG: preprotein translocase subunit SecE [Firmicutes bacterium]|nr:preprotein translocase subunit SecE [Bacillota bacterium]
MSGKKKLREKKEREQRENRAKGFGRAVKGLFSELKKVSWPTFPMVVKQTAVVLTVVAFFTIVLFGVDRGLFELHQLLIG